MAFETYTVWGKKQKSKQNQRKSTAITITTTKRNYRSLFTATAKKLIPTLCYCGLPQFPFYQCKLHIIYKTFILTYPCIEKSKFKTHPRKSNYSVCKMKVILESTPQTTDEIIWPSFDPLECQYALSMCIIKSCRVVGVNNPGKLFSQAS